jgi:hypothetical protein
VLQAEFKHLRGARPDESDTGVFACLRESGILREKTVAGMHGIRAGCTRRLENRRAIQIAGGRHRRADADRFVGEHHMHGVAIGFRIDRHRGNAEALECANHAAGNFAAIGNQDFVECHWASQMVSRTGVGL